MALFDIENHVDNFIKSNAHFKQICEDCFKQVEDWKRHAVPAARVHEVVPMVFDQLQLQLNDYGKFAMSILLLYSHTHLLRCTCEGPLRSWLRPTTENAPMRQCQSKCATSNPLPCVLSDIKVTPPTRKEVDQFLKESDALGNNQLNSTEFEVCRARSLEILPWPPHGSVLGTSCSVDAAISAHISENACSLFA